MNGVLLRRNDYNPPAVYPPLTVFVMSGFPGGSDTIGNAGRASPYANSSLEVSPILVREWAGHGTAPIALHMPLEGELLQKSLANLGGATRSLAEGILREVSRIKEGGVRFRDVFLPSPCLHSVLGEVDERPFLRPLLRAQLERRVRGGWLTDLPQTRWSQIQHKVDSDVSGYLSYAPVYPPDDLHWNDSVVIESPAFQTVESGPTYTTIEAWVAALAEEGVRPVPVVATSDDAESWNNANRVIRAVEKAWGTLEPLGLINVNLDTINIPVPRGWWTLGGPNPSLIEI